MRVDCDKARKKVTFAINQLLKAMTKRGLTGRRWFGRIIIHAQTCVGSLSDSSLRLPRSPHRSLSFRLTSPSTRIYFQRSKRLGSNVAGDASSFSWCFERPRAGAEGRQSLPVIISALSYRPGTLHARLGSKPVHSLDVSYSSQVFGTVTGHRRVVEDGPKGLRPVNPTPVCWSVVWSL